MSKQEEYIKALEDFANQKLPVNFGQIIHLALISITNFNGIDGKKISNDLITNKDLWYNAYLDDQDSVQLADLDKSIKKSNLMFIISSKVDDNKLEQLASSWNANRVRWLSDESTCLKMGTTKYAGHRILEIWWNMEKQNDI